MTFKCSNCGVKFEGPLSYSSYFDSVMPDNEREPDKVFCSYDCSVEYEEKKCKR